MTSTKSAAYVDFQQRAKEFSVGDEVSPLFSLQVIVGRVVAVWPAIGMVDVEWPHGSERVPVEDLQRGNGSEFTPPETDSANVPGGEGTVSVPGGPKDAVTRVATAYLKKSLYWAARDRHYKATAEEITSGQFNCPKCKGAFLRPATYKRAEGVSDRLLACPECLFLIKRSALIGHPDYIDDGIDGVQADRKVV